MRQLGDQPARGARRSCAGDQFSRHYGTERRRNGHARKRTALPRAHRGCQRYHLHHRSVWELHLGKYQRREDLGIRPQGTALHEPAGLGRSRIPAGGPGGPSGPKGRRKPTAHGGDLIARDGHRVALEVSGRLQFLKGSPTGVLCVARDISQRRRTERLEHNRREILEMVAQNRPLDAVLWRVEEMIELYSRGCGAYYLNWRFLRPARPARRPDHGHNHAHNHGHRGLSGPSGGAHPGLRRRWAGAVGDIGPIPGGPPNLNLC